MEALFRGDKTALDVLNDTGAGSSLESFVSFIRQQVDDSQYLHHISHTKPNLGVLEIGAGMGEKTVQVIKHMLRANGMPLYSRYVATVASSGLLNTAKERLKGIRNFHLATLDITQDLSHGCEDFDRVDEPLLEVERWQDELAAAGYAVAERIYLGTVQTVAIRDAAASKALADVLDKFVARKDQAANGNNIFASSEVVVTQTIPGRLDTLTWSALSSSAVSSLVEDEIKIEVYASGLNFRDVFVGMKVIPGRQELIFGYETAGIVHRVRPRVSRLAIGGGIVGADERIFATLRAHEALFEKLPAHTSFVEAAGIATVFLTAMYALRDLGRLQKGQSVLIHSGTGGVGLAAIQVAPILGAEVYRTVGGDSKAEYLTETFGLARSHIFHSRNDSFVQDLLRETQGRGVGVALNSLAGELLHATWKCVAKWGTMVEISKRGLLNNAQLDMAPFLGNRKYCYFNIGELGTERPEMCSRQCAPLWIAWPKDC
ncbi:hypothetical protein MCOR25_004872 [Pyricularia grisea]|nr:hypothetical protein MCOR25_004872 [Pyricularia grisea]